MREQRLVHVFPNYFCAALPLRAVPLPLDTSAGAQQTRDAVKSKLDATQLPIKPAGHRGKQTGRTPTRIIESVRPQGLPDLIGVNAKEKMTQLSDIVARERSKAEITHLGPKRERNMLNNIYIEAHTAGTPFLGSVDAKRVKHVTEMLDIENEEYGMIGEDTDLFPVASAALSVDQIIGAMQIDGPESLQIALRALLTEYTDIFSNYVGEKLAMVEPMTLQVNPKKWKYPKKTDTASALVPICGRGNPPSDGRPISSRGD
jgi:hypothetical protein